MFGVAGQEPERNVISCPAARDTLIIGLGNPLRGDDGVGIRVARALAGRTLPDGVEVVEGGTQGLGLVNLMEGRRRVILVDAASMGQMPGQFVRFALDEVRLRGDDQSLSVHAAGLHEALLLAQALGTLPDQVIVFGVQPARVDWDDTLSPEIEATLPALMEAVLAEALHRSPLAKIEGNSQPE